MWGSVVRGGDLKSEVGERRSPGIHLPNLTTDFTGFDACHRENPTSNTVCIVLVVVLNELRYTDRLAITTACCSDVAGCSVSGSHVTR